MVASQRWQRAMEASTRKANPVRDTLEHCFASSLTVKAPWTELFVIPIILAGVHH